MKVRSMESMAAKGPQVLRPRQIKRLISTPDRRTHKGRRDAALLAVMALGGLRVGEACRLTRDDVEIDGPRLRLLFAGKGGRVRPVNLSPTAARLLKGWLDDPRAHRHWVFDGRRNEHLSPRAAQEALRKIVRSAGLPAWLHPHSLRHSCASAIMRATGDLFLVQHILGHKSPTTTSRYYLAFSPKDADRGADAMEGALHPRRSRK